MVLTLTVPDRYSWVVLTTVGAGWLTCWQSFVVMKHRQAASIEYPQAYAEKAEVAASFDAMKFNCAQRAHHNTLESMPQVVLCTLLAGLRYPEIATGFGVAYLTGRVAYTLGYATGHPNKRLRGSISMFATMGVHILATWTAGKIFLESL